ncbi:copper resistance protein CopC [Dactylosporangium sp. AC04546]|uniref:copper resistance CopC family protein n=1 Tax=Dactylosporangium sp. AC04546 TaxID=2862460 RepID=UPI001EE14609|nr:copper resistance CopC family protein [Dactylosporangium sp. AC04546]WVK79354.1 copper resistance protein CopC [Dactylosporangium sp. AC04546]
MRLSMTVRATLAAAAAAALVLLVPAQPAWAHAKLLKSDPADGATVTAPVAAVTFTFNEMVKQQFSTVVVTGVDGASYSDGAPKSVDKTLTQPVKALPAGVVRVAWRTVSVDGHPIEGQFTFTNAAAAPTTAAPSSPPQATTEPASAPSSAAATVAADPASDDGGAGGLLWAVVGAVVVVLVLAGGVVWWRRRGTSA